MLTASIAVHVPTDQEILQRKRRKDMKKKAREAAGGGNTESSDSVATIESDLQVSSPPTAANDDAVPAGHMAAAREVTRRGTARFGTAHFKDPKMAGGLAALLSKKVR
eukprot:Gregarina_sp_Poly_1__6455@NODE_344_length_9409_cov_268_562406_g288_i0_p10_GENE_NODE_344_length_9409_cov_268_562406_g288_i0NODE_344_length_9409_cov_268_562406_g288_i0_p10_ORF_typecomplete_len108_score23_00_NODE_344_length_9409_cov_268_562406_g288_i056695992